MNRILNLSPTHDGPIRNRQPDTAMKRILPKLVPGKEYLFTHKRKRTFRAVFKRIVRAPSTDAIDEFYYECEVDSNLSGNPWSRMNDRVLVLLRPSLITVVQNTPTNLRATDPTKFYFADALGQGKTLVRTEENWKDELLKSVRSAIRLLRYNLRRRMRNQA